MNVPLPAARVDAAADRSIESVPVGFDGRENLIDRRRGGDPPVIRAGERVRHSGSAPDVITDLSLVRLKNRPDKEKPFLPMCQRMPSDRDPAQGLNRRMS